MCTSVSLTLKAGVREFRIPCHHYLQVFISHPTVEHQHCQDGQGMINLSLHCFFVFLFLFTFEVGGFP